MPHTRSKEGQVSPLRVPLRHYRRRQYSYTPPSRFLLPHSPLPTLNPPTEMAEEEELPTLLSRVNIKFPTFRGLSTEDADDHVRRFLSLCRGRGLNREDAYLILFPSTLDSLADKWFSQFEDGHFVSWTELSTAFCNNAFRPSNYRERILDQLENLELQLRETFAELMTRTKALVNKLPDSPGDFMVRKWVEKALLRSTQKKLRENLRQNATLADLWPWPRK